MSDLVENPNCWFSHAQASITYTKFSCVSHQIRGHRVPQVRCQVEATHGRARGEVGPAHTIYQIGAGIRAVKTCLLGDRGQVLWPKVCDFVWILEFSVYI